MLVSGFELPSKSKLPKIRAQGHTQGGCWLQFYCLWIQEIDVSEKNEDKKEVHKIDKETEYITKVQHYKATELLKIYSSTLSCPLDYYM